MTSGETDERKIAHLEAVRADLRDEMKMRMGQRDNLSIQVIVSLAVIIGVAIENKLPIVVIVAPAVVIYYSVMFLYSLRVNYIMANYLHTIIEPQLAQLVGVSVEDEWEHFFTNKIGRRMRAPMILVLPWIIFVASFTYLYYTSFQFVFFLDIASIVYLIIITFETFMGLFFWSRVQF